MYKITELKQGVRNPDRVNVFVDGKFSFSLDISQVVDFGIKVGMEISEDKLAELKKASEFGKLYQRTLEWALMRPHSERECRDYLRRKIFEKKLDKDYIDKIIEKLKAKKYLDDYRFSEWYVEYLSTKKNYSLKRIEMELLKKGIERSAINEVLENSEVCDTEKLAEIVAKKRAKYPDDKKLMQYLLRQGFSYDLVRDVVAESSDLI